MSLPKPLYALVLEESLRPTRNGDRYFMQYTFRTTAGNLKANQWNAVAGSLSDPSFPHKGDIIELTEYVDQLESHKSILVNHFKRISKDLLPDHDKIICEFPKADKKQFDAAVKVLQNKTLYENPATYAFVVACYSKLDKKLLMACPAASKVHHSVAGGLIIHTAEVMLLCKEIYNSCFKNYPFISNDVIMASAALHDIGKVKTYYIDDLGMPEQLATEKMLGHMFYGMELVQNVGNELKINSSFINEIMHCIAAHHGKTEFGSIKPVQSQEALIVHCADLVSSRNGMIENKLQETIKSNSALPDVFNIYSDPYFASLGMQTYIKNSQTQFV